MVISSQIGISKLPGLYFSVANCLFQGVYQKEDQFFQGLVGMGFSFLSDAPTRKSSEMIDILAFLVKLTAWNERSHWKSNVFFVVLNTIEMVDFLVAILVYRGVKDEKKSDVPICVEGWCWCGVAFDMVSFDVGWRCFFGQPNF